MCHKVISSFSVEFDVLSIRPFKEAYNRALSQKLILLFTIVWLMVQEAVILMTAEHWVGKWDVSRSITSFCSLTCSPLSWLQYYPRLSTKTKIFILSTWNFGWNLNNSNLIFLNSKWPRWAKKVLEYFSPNSPVFLRTTKGENTFL